MWLFVVAPMFTGGGEKELERRLAAWADWWKENGKAVQERYQLSAWHLLELVPDRDVYIGGHHPVRIQLPKDPRSLVQKGLAVRFSILAALDWVDRHGVEARSNAAFALVDGSGAFDYANIFILLDALLTPPIPDVVFGSRPPGNSGMAPWRKAIEEFENYLILQRLPAKTGKVWKKAGGFPDGQAGCWAFRMSAIKALPLSASSYEIEYDLLASSILGGLKILFTKPLIMQERVFTDFGTEPNVEVIDRCIRKLDFIQYKLDLSDSGIREGLDAFTKFSREQASRIPDEYRAAVRTKFRVVSART